MEQLAKEKCMAIAVLLTERLHKEETIKTICNWQEGKLTFDDTGTFTWASLIRIIQLSVVVIVVGVVVVLNVSYILFIIQNHLAHFNYMCHKLCLGDYLGYFLLILSQAN